MMAASLEQVVHTNLQCPVCRRFFKDPKILPCSHTYCRGCLENLLECHWRKDVLLCPTCGGQTWVPGGNVGGLQSNLTVRSLVEAVETQDHSNCIPNYDERRLCFRSQRSNGLQLVQLIKQKESKWVLRALLPVGLGNVTGMAISPNNEMAVVCGYPRGIVIFSSEGIMKGTVLEDVCVWALDFMPDTGYVIRDIHNKIFLYTDRSEKLDVTFETMDDEGSLSGGLTVGKDGLIFVGSRVCKKIQVFKPEGGKAIREITCNGFEPWEIIAMKSSQAIVVKSGLDVYLINDVSGAIIHSITKAFDKPCPAVCQDNSVIIAWVCQDSMSIVHYKQEPNKCINNIITDFKICGPSLLGCHLQAFKTGEIAFCTSDRLYIFHDMGVKFSFADET